VLRDYPNLEGIGRLTLLQSLRCVRLVLWDEGQQRLVSFGEMRQRHFPVESKLRRRVERLARERKNFKLTGLP
jgi:hypothetical protein